MLNKSRGVIKGTYTKQDQHFCYKRRTISYGLNLPSKRHHDIKRTKFSLEMPPYTLKPSNGLHVHVLGGIPFVQALKLLNWANLMRVINH